MMSKWVPAAAALLLTGCLSYPSDRFPEARPVELSHSLRIEAVNAHGCEPFLDDPVRCSWLQGRRSVDLEARVQTFAVMPASREPATCSLLLVERSLPGPWWQIPLGIVGRGSLLAIPSYERRMFALDVTLRRGGEAIWSSRYEDFVHI